MLSVLAVLRKAHPLNRKVDLEFKTLCPPADFTFSIDSSEQEVKNQQNVIITMLWMRHQQDQE